MRPFELIENEGTEETRTVVGEGESGALETIVIDWDAMDAGEARELIDSIESRYEDDGDEPEGRALEVLGRLDDAEYADDLDDDDDDDDEDDTLVVDDDDDDDLDDDEGFYDFDDEDEDDEDDYDID